MLRQVAILYIPNSFNNDILSIMKFSSFLIKEIIGLGNVNFLIFLFIIFIKNEENEEIFLKCLSLNYIEIRDDASHPVVSCYCK